MIRKKRKSTAPGSKVSHDDELKVLREEMEALVSKISELPTQRNMTIFRVGGRKGRISRE